MTSQDSIKRLDDDAATLPLAELRVEVGDNGDPLREARRGSSTCSRCSPRLRSLRLPLSVAPTVVAGTNGFDDRRFPRSARLLSRSATATAIRLALDAATGVVSPGD